MYQTEIKIFENMNKIIRKNERKEQFSFFDELDSIDFRDDLKYK